MFDFFPTQFLAANSRKKNSDKNIDNSSNKSKKTLTNVLSVAFLVRVREMISQVQLGRSQSER